MEEIWKTIPGFSQYEISNIGRLRNKSSGRLLAWQKRQRGYLSANLLRDDNPIRKQLLAHRAVLLAFVGPCPDLHEVDHLNTIKTDNRVENLEYVTRRENIRRFRGTCKRMYAVPIGVYPHNRSFAAKITFAGKYLHLGKFPTPELASARYQEVKKQIEAGTFVLPVTALGAAP